MSTKKYSILWEDDEASGYEVDGVVYKNLEDIPNQKDMLKIMAMLNAAELNTDLETEQKISSSPENLILNIFTGVAALMLLIAGLSAFSAVKKITSEKAAPGIVVDMVVRREYVNEQDRIVNEYSCPVVSFVADDGRRRDVQLSECSDPPSFETGDEVTVRYNPEKPIQARIDSFDSNALMWILPSITGVLGLAFMGAVWVVRKLISLDETA